MVGQPTGEVQHSEHDPYDRNPTWCPFSHSSPLKATTKQLRYIAREVNGGVIMVGPPTDEVQHSERYSYDRPSSWWPFLHSSPPTRTYSSSGTVSTAVPPGMSLT